MKDEEAQEVFRKLTSILEQQGLAWVVAQVREQIGLGQTKRESVPVDFGWPEVPTTETVRRGRQRREEMVKTLPYSRKEQLGLLLDGISRAVVGTSEMESECVEFFR